MLNLINPIDQDEFKKEFLFREPFPYFCIDNFLNEDFATYYYTKKMPDDWGGEKHSTVFKARPNQWFRGNVAMPIENTIRFGKHMFKDAKHVIKKLIAR